MQDLGGQGRGIAVQANDKELVTLPKRIKVRAVDRMGELLEQIPSRQGKRTDKQPHTAADSKSEVARAAGISPRQQAQATQVHNVPRESFERQVESENPPTVTALARQGRKLPVEFPVDKEARAFARFKKSVSRIMKESLWDHPDFGKVAGELISEV